MRTKAMGCLAVLSVATALCVGSPATAADSVVAGSTPPLPSQALFCSGGLTVLQGAVTTPPTYDTVAGVITSWSVMPGHQPHQQRLALKVARHGSGTSYTITGSAANETLVEGRLNTFQTRIPVAAGDVLGLFLAPTTDSNLVTCGYTGSAGDTIITQPILAPEPAVGAVITPSASVPGRVDVSVVIEPDSDGDGYGDLTQDACPTLKNSHTDCIPPDTFLKSGPSKRLVLHGKDPKVKVTVSFFASEKDATFTCQVDRGPARPCHSILKTKVKTGKHTLTITAIDAVGNVDPKPLTVRFRVKREA